MTDCDFYEHILKKDMWHEFEIKEVLKTNSSIIGLLKAAIAVKTLEPICTVQIADDGASVYGFRQTDIMEWVIAKDIAVPDKLREWHDKQSRHAPKEVLAYLDTKHPLHSPELSIAISAWEAVLRSNPGKPKTGSRKQLIDGWLKAYSPPLKPSEIKRISAMINPDKPGGAPKTK
jgi:hypothetical protein